MRTRGVLMSEKNVMYFDLIILTILSFLSDFFGYYLVGEIGSSFYLTFSLAITIIAMVRWGTIGVITYVVSGLSLLYLKSSTSIGINFIYEVVANAFVCVPFLIHSVVYKTIKVEKIISLTIMSIITLSLAKGVVLVIVDGEMMSIINFFMSSMLINIMNIGLILLLKITKSQLLIDMVEFTTKEINQEDL